MGIIDGMMGNASEMDAAAAQQEFGRLLAPGETIEHAYVLIRDMFLFTSRRLILVDKQGLTGKKTEYVSVPYSKITRFAIETAGAFDLDAELKIWVTGAPEPIAKQFNRKLDIYKVQAVLAAHV
ncbi:MAG TPA: PH domain-containing protein [Candidatus Thermoplasmatota archaeon]|nr:PH domain-containing protein [Candidatus Thermoplasmatota archaeon]